MTDAHGVDPNQEIEWIPTMKLGGSRSGNRVVPYIEIRWIPKRKFCTGESGLFWLTGSQPFHLMKGVSESLAGRVGVLHLLGLSRDEQRNAGSEYRSFLPTPEEIDRRTRTKPPLSLKDLFALIFRGSFPAFALDETRDRTLFSAPIFRPICSGTSGILRRWATRWRFFAFSGLVRHGLASS